MQIGNATEKAEAAKRKKEFKSDIKNFDVVIFSTSSSNPIVSSKEIDLIMSERKHKKLLLVDLSVPRNIEPSNYNLKGLEITAVK